MEYNYITNPKTNRKCRTNTILGKNIINNYINQLGSGMNASEKSEKDKILKNANVYAPDGYFTGLTPKETKKRLERMKEGTKKSHKDPDAYRDFETDFRDGERIKTKPSRYTKQWKSYFPDANSLEEKAKLTGVPMDIIEKVYNKGLAAWRTGHRPGANVQQWGYARVHSFLVKGKTFYTTDRKLALEAIERSKKAAEWFNWVDGLCDGSKNREKNNWCENACKKTKCK
tara:strand:+ start:468 stop:1154 length:687 start_codon:yes stop_codon:yes gene_type:complete